MAKEFQRTDRVGSQMQRELAVLIRDEVNDPRLGMLTVQEVRVVRDFSHAKVYFTLLGETLTEREAVKLLNEAAPFLRHELGQRMKLRTLPELHFVYDESIRRGNDLDDLISRAVAEDAEHNQE